MVDTRVLGLLVAGALAVPLAGCGEDREGSVNVEGGTGTETSGTKTTGTSTGGASTTTTPGGTASKTFKISETEFKLTPASFKLAKPGVVAFTVTNDGATVHALEVEGPSGEFETEEIQPGDKVTLKADVSQGGTYELYCPVGDHEDRGMVGKLVVGGRTTGRGEDDDSGPGRGDDSGPGKDDDHGGSDRDGDDDGPSGSDSDDDSGGATAPDY